MSFHYCVVIVLIKYQRRSVLLIETSVNFAMENSLPPHEWQKPDSLQFTDVIYVIK